MDLLADPFFETALLLVVSAAIGILAVRLRQPLIVAFIAVGILVGPSALDLIRLSEQLELLSQLGISLLLFIVGLKLDLHLIRTLGPVALATGLGQVTFTSIFGFLLATAFGFPSTEALYVAVAVTFSSTIIIVKLLSDKREIDSLHGRIAVGLLIVQDIVVVLVMIGLTALGDGQAENLGLEILSVLGRGILFLLGLVLLMRFAIPRLLEQLAQSQELLVLSAIAWAVMLSSVGELLGFSSEVGAFLAGVSLASSNYRELIGARLTSLRDFLLLFFFINLGARLDLNLLGAQMGSAILLSLFVLIGKPIIVIAIMGMMGYHKRTGLLAGLMMAQISEFSLILAALGLNLGHIDDETVALITLVGLITIGLSSYLILYSHRLYPVLAPLLSVFERKRPFRETEGDVDVTAKNADIIIFGLGRYGGWLLNSLSHKGLEVHGVDFDPETLRRLRRQGFTVHYGDAEDPEYPGTLALSHVQWVVSSIPARHVNLTLLHALRHHGYAGKTAVTAHHRHDDEVLQAAGADLILRPFVDAAERAAEELAESMASRP